MKAAPAVLQIADPARLRPKEAISREKAGRWLRWEYADLVVAAAVALIFVIFAIFGLLIWQGYGQTVSSAKARVEAASANIANEVDWVVSAGLVFLESVERGASGNPAGLTEEQRTSFDDVLAGLPGNFQLGVYDAEGKAIGNGETIPMPDDLSGYADFAALAGGREWMLLATEGGSDAPPPLVIARRLSKDGEFEGVALLAGGLDLLEAFAAPMKLGTNSTVTILRDDGWVIARYPALKAPLNLAALPVMDTLEAEPAGSYLVAASAADGVARVVGFHHLPRLGLLAGASVTQESVFGPLWYSVWVVTFLIGPIALALLGGSLLTARLLRKTVQTSRSLSAALEHNEVLFREIHHRVKNNLQSVASLLQMQPISVAIKSDMAQRIAAMSAVHEHIYRSNNFSTVSVGDYLETLIAGIKAGQDPRVDVVAKFENLAVDRDSATPLGLIVNEVVSNAFKHAFSDGREGTISITLARNEQGMGELTIADNGVGFDPQAPSKGIGRKLISALTAQIGGTANFSSESGSKFTLVFPVHSGNS